MQLEMTFSPSFQDVDLLTKRIHQDAVEKGITAIAQPFAFYVKTDDGEMIAGCNGSIVYGSIYTDQLWVSPSHRKRGWGRKLMEQVHQLGLKHGCSLATVCSMSFQDAQKFYEELGYSCDFKRPGYADRASCLFMKRNL